MYNTQNMCLLCIFMSCLLCIAVSAESLSADSNCGFNQQMKNHLARDRLVKLNGLRYSIADNMNTYTYNIGICKRADDSIPFAGIIQRKTDAPRTPVIVGKFSQANFMAGNDWILLEYLGGQKYTNGTCNNVTRRGSIMILCDPNETQGSVQLVEENTEKNAQCYFLFELTHAAVCSAKSLSAAGLSAGSIFVIVLCSVTGVYLLGGFLYQRFVAGAKGWEQIPHQGFWQDFGSLLADGCDLACRGASSRRQTTTASREYKGLGDDQLQSDDFDRDEHLLPM